tara:strand:- start:260 stop:1000 length:741 start_codon:yes stop_codon:yes gene_type:complete
MINIFFKYFNINCITLIILLILITFIYFIYSLISLFSIGNRKLKKFLKKKIKGKKILLVGNGVSAIKRKKLFIDKKYNVIIRFNNGTPKDYESYVGSRTDYIFTAGRFPLIKYKKYNFCLIKKSHLIKYPFLYVFPINRLFGHYHQHYNYNLHSFDINKNFLLYYSYEIKDKNNLTTGFSLIKMLLDKNIPFDYTGFDSLNNYSNYDHYYENDNPSTKFAKTGHNLEYEKKIFLSHKNLKICKDIS